MGTYTYLSRELSSLCRWLPLLRTCNSNSPDSFKCTPSKIIQDRGEDDTDVGGAIFRNHRLISVRRQLLAEKKVLDLLLLLNDMAAQVVMNSIATPHSWGLNKSPKLSSSRTVVSRCFLPATLQARRTRTRFTVAATSNEGGESKDPATSTSSVPEETKVTASDAVNTVSEKRAKAEAEVKKGQRTAIVTGAISVLLGVGYLVLIQLLDTRGVILVPPPPEAFNP